MIVKVAALTYVRTNDRKSSTSGCIPYESRPFFPQAPYDVTRGTAYSANNTKLPNSSHFANDSGSLRL